MSNIPKDNLVLIFSAHYGLVPLTKILEPYNCSLNRIPSTRSQDTTKAQRDACSVASRQTFERLVPIVRSQLEDLKQLAGCGFCLALSSDYCRAIQLAGGEWLLERSPNIRAGCTMFTVNKKIKEHFSTLCPKE